MLKCPKCGGYGKAVSTRNLKDSVIRYHKCDDCGESFTSTQRVDNCKITEETINAFLQSDKFNMLIYPLFTSFELTDFSMYNNSALVQDYEFSKFVLSSVEFVDSTKHTRSRFDVYLKVADDKFNGVIKLVNLDDNHNIKNVEAIIGTIDNLNGYAKLNLDIPTVNKLNKHK